MFTATVSELQADTAAILSRIAAGESVTLLDNDRPVAEIKPIPRDSPAAAPRPFGLARGEFVTPADFDAPLTDELLDAFEGR